MKQGNASKGDKNEKKRDAPQTDVAGQPLTETNAPGETADDHAQIQQLLKKVEDPDLERYFALRVHAMAKK